MSEYVDSSEACSSFSTKETIPVIAYECKKASVSQESDVNVLRNHDEEMDAKVKSLRNLIKLDPSIDTFVRKKDLEAVSLQRFLRARNGSVSAAFDQFINALRWRKQHKVDLVLDLDDEFAAQDRWGSAYWHGVDKLGRPILVLRGCQHDPALFCTESTQRFLIWKLERKLIERDVDDIVVIFDCANMTRHNMDLKLIRTMIPLLHAFYPERLGVCIVYPVSQLTWLVCRMILPLLDSSTEKKLMLVRDGKSKAILKVIDVDQLQKRFGGEDPIEYGITGLGLVSPSELEIVINHSRNYSMSQSSDKVVQDCLGPRAFSVFSDTTEENEDALSLDADAAVRNNPQIVFGSDAEFEAMMKEREKEDDRFQLNLRYQASRVNITNSEKLDDVEIEDVESESAIDSISEFDGDFVSVKPMNEFQRKLKRKRFKRFVKKFVEVPFSRMRSRSQRLQEVSGSLPSTVLKARSEAVDISPESSFSMDECPQDNTFSEVESTRNDIKANLDSQQKLLENSSDLKSEAEVKIGRSRSRLGSLDATIAMEAGASMTRLSPEDPRRIPNSWSTIHGKKFDTRAGPNFSKTRIKRPSGAALYETLCCDVFKLPTKHAHISSFMQLNVGSTSLDHDDFSAPPLPELLIVNLMLPAYSPSLLGKKKVDGPGYSVVFFGKLGQWARNSPEDPSVQLWSRFVHAHDGDPFRERLKMITRLENPGEFSLSSLTRSIVRKYNGVPWLVRPEYEFHKGKGYFEIDIDFHLFRYLVLSHAVPVLHSVTNTIIDCALMVQAESNVEMPERVLAAVTVRDLNLKLAAEVDFVQLQESVKKGIRLSRPKSFIDRDRKIYELESLNGDEMLKAAIGSDTQPNEIEHVLEETVINKAKPRYAFQTMGSIVVVFLAFFWVSMPRFASLLGQ